MKISVASRNPAKLAAVRDAFNRRFPEAAIELSGCAVESGVPDQPFGDEETRRGARQRAEAAARVAPEADWWVGLEGGLEEIDGVLTAFAWIVVRDRAGRLGEARSATLPLPSRVKDFVDAGLELGEANDRVFGTHNSKHAGGAFALLTGGLLTREGVYADTVLIALTPLVEPVYRDEA